MKALGYVSSVRRFFAAVAFGGLLLGGGCRAGEVALDGVYDGVSSAIEGVIVGVVFEIFDID
jgi:hypothetical protein